jgi:transcriptional regulator with XRE-family HTH domain
LRLQIAFAGVMPSARRVRAVTQSFSIELKQARVRAKITQQTLAERAEIDPVFVSFLENGHRQPSLAVLLALEQAMALSPGTLMRRTVKRIAIAANKPRTASRKTAASKKSRRR